MRKLAVFMVILIILPINAQKTDLLKVTYDHAGSLWHTLEVETPIAKAGAGLLIIPGAGALLGLGGKIGTKDCYLDCNLLVGLGVSDEEFSLGGDGDCKFHCGQLTVHWYEKFHLLIAEDQLKCDFYTEGSIDSANVKRVKIGWGVGCLVRKSPWGAPIARASCNTNVILLEDGRRHKGWYEVGVNIDGVWVKGVIAKRLLSLMSGKEIPKNHEYSKKWSWEELERSFQ